MEEGKGRGRVSRRRRWIGWIGIEVNRTERACKSIEWEWLKEDLNGEWQRGEVCVSVRMENTRTQGRCGRKRGE